ncbi:sarcosine oxidase subunit delta [Falsiroseomonas sp. CW058]|uniref:sarcosine oxidase subunit delta n=1 Tax=Falsiroseomonas sp. CW058 TaxID=3388664 RepID=UPI003D3160BF
MLIPCPHCGARDESEFTYRGDATVARPAPDAGTDAFHDYVYLRANPRGWHVEWWQHGACRQWLRVVRHTVTHEIRQAALPGEAVEVPGA